MTNSHSPSSAESAVEHLQARGRHYDIIREAIAAYDEYMLDDDYDAQRTLDSIIKRMRERTALTDAPVIQSEKVTEQQIEDGAKALFGEGWDKTATPANRRYCREKAKAIFAAMAAQPTDKIQSTTLAQSEQVQRAERLRLELEKIAWMDEFLDDIGVAKEMMRIAREAVQADEDAAQPPAAPVETKEQREYSCTGLCNDGSGEGCNCGPAAYQRSSADSDLVKRLRSTAADMIDFHGKTMKEWDKIRQTVETCRGGDLPRLMFESLLESFSELMVEAADALTSTEPQPATDTIPVPKAALAWLDGAEPDADGKWFGECAPDPSEIPMRRFWWRSKFRSMIPSLALTRPHLARGDK